MKRRKFLKEVSNQLKCDIFIAVILVLHFVKTKLLSGKPGEPKICVPNNCSENKLVIHKTHLPTT